MTASTSANPSRIALITGGRRALPPSAALDWLNLLYARRSDAGSRPIKGYLQVAKIALFSAAASLARRLSNRSVACCA